MFSNPTFLRFPSNAPFLANIEVQTLNTRLSTNLSTSANFFIVLYRILTTQDFESTNEDANGLNCLQATNSRAAQAASAERIHLFPTRTFTRSSSDTASQHSAHSATEACQSKLTALCWEEDMLMAFEEKPLDLTIDFSNVEENSVTMIIGKGQTVY
ncbi:hypothetical protein V500_00979 [Pseudogymnoascus sp. VKM F-4518 (FW-2643)]|nr:hypothetical protein V500_00979 [Pseudogymnoascus sp. VKM F-4518 (FW-2643)]